MRSPNGKISVVRTKDVLADEDGRWAGRIDIPGYPFRLRGRTFTDKMVFSKDSRFLAAEENFELEGGARILVFDFVARKEVVAHEVKDWTVNYTVIMSLEWTDSISLRICTFSPVFGHGELVWKIVPEGATDRTAAPSEECAYYIKQPEDTNFENWAFTLISPHVPSRFMYLVTDELLSQGAEILRGGRIFDVRLSEKLRDDTGFESVTAEAVGSLVGVGAERISATGLIMLVPKPKVAQQDFKRQGDPTSGSNWKLP
jgi:hypothetical protein